MNKKSLQIVALVMVLIFLGTIFVFPLIYSPDEPTHQPAPELEIEN